MDAVAKADRFISLMSELGQSDKKWFFGNETDDPLRFAFDKKRMVHPTIKGTVLPKDRWASTWHRLVSSPRCNSSRAAYVHIPFCSTRCLYCGFFQNHNDSDLQDAYIDRLIEDIWNSSQYPLIKDNTFNAVYIGGGTPSDMSARNIKRLLFAIKECLPLANDCELTFEARIHDFDDEKVNACIEGGINRFSLGVQSFNTQVRQKVGRLEKGQRLKERLQYIQGLNHAAVVIDLMYGLPMQTMDIWEDDVKTLIQLGIDGGDLYQLNVFEDSKLNEALAKGNIASPAKTPEQAVMFKRGWEIMQKTRYRRLSICHWANTTRERNLYNSLAKSASDIMPFGAGSGGKIGGYTMFVHRDIKNYMQGIDRGEKPIIFMMSPPEEYKLYYEVIRQMEEGYLDLLSFKTLYGIDMEEVFSELFNAWIRKGLVSKNDIYLDITVAGQFWYVNLTQALIDSLLMINSDGDYSLPIKSIAAQG